jgi:arabinogalactan endo-1,4-beta-galactosidase
MILQHGDLVWPIDWNRNSFLINKGIQAVRDISEDKNKDIEVMLHIAQPENALWWFEQATENGVTDYDWIGLSYYPKWSDYGLDNLYTPLNTLINTYNKRLMIVETAYPFTLEENDAANNILGEDSLITGFPATQQGQLNYLNQLKTIVENAGGEGVIYWEPAWVSTNCSTLWGQGSHWDNATLFDHNNKATLTQLFALYFNNDDDISTNLKAKFHTKTK